MVSSLLTVMTWNIWFDKTNRKTRTETLLNEIIFYNPDIVALQEVVEESLEIIIAKMTPTYYIIGMNMHSHTHSNTHYDTLILSKYPPLQWDRYHLPKTKMGRNLLLTTLQTPTRQIFVGTFHLESVFNRHNNLAEELKTSQLKYIYAISPMNTILMGDTNLMIDELKHQLNPKSEDQSSASASANNHLIDIYSISPCHCPQIQPSIEIEAHCLGVCPQPLSKRGLPPNDEPISRQITHLYSSVFPSDCSLGVCPQPLFERGLPPNDEPISRQITHLYSSVFPSDVCSLGVCPFLKGAGAGATYCGQTNKNIKNKSIQSRLDRIYVKILRNSLKVHFYGLTGTFTQPSDHFGVFSQIEI